jgi:hypothetical protein
MGVIKYNCWEAVLVLCLWGFLEFWSSLGVGKGVMSGMWV